jgi:ferritin-like metal-binding protein YciE
MSKSKTLRDVLADELRDLHSTEMQQLKAYLRMARASSNAILRSLFHQHLEQTKRDLFRVERVAKSFGLSPLGKPSNGMMGLTADLAEKLNSPPSSARDIQLVCLAQKMSHYKVVGYAGASTVAGLLGFTEAVKLLQTTLEEETAAGTNLNELGMDYHACVPFTPLLMESCRQRKAG